MLSESKRFLFWASIPEDKPVKVGEIPFLVAEAIHTSELAQAAAEVNVWEEIQRLVKPDGWTVRNPLDMGPHTCPLGQALRTAVIFPWEAVKWFEHWGVGLRLLPAGNGPELWNLANAATAIATQEGWHIGARGTFLEQMMQAVRDRVLTVRHPHTDQPYWPNVVRDFYELVTPTDVNQWLALDPASSLRWKASERAPSQSQPNSSGQEESSMLDERLRLDAVDREAKKRERGAEQAATGWYYLFEVAEYITRQRGINEAYSDRLLKSMIHAAEQELLKVFDELHQTKLAKGEEIHSLRMTRREHVNAWLLADGAGYQWADESRAAIGKSEQSPPSTYGMPDGQFRECVQAIISRIKFLESWGSRNAPAAEGAGLVSVGYAIRKLAIQYLKPYDRWPGREHESFPQEVTDGWALKWYFNYQTAMRDHIRGVQEAVRKGELTLRTLNRAKVPDDVAQSWCNSDPWPKAATDLRLFPDCSKWDVMASDWPDSLGIPSGGFDRDEWADWAERAGLVELGLAGAIAIKAIAANSHTEAAQEVEQAILEDPRMRIQAAAAEYWIELLAKNCNPTVHGISEYIAKWCAENEVRTKGNVNPRAETIRNSILNSQSWTPPTMSREKASAHVQAKKQVAQPAQVSQPQVAKPVQDASKQ
ncbi:hypothetical protein [Aquabacterium sp.]|uniref:hypothetical protein n=1 Tax=Aquabacterium sp. TaxID=1872578 RepID=UPI00248A7E77|nr:hypothetical protein [Aquabacterium sp.]MDI1259587.1 hypothetical protein [Aquabacterium sp.]